jgi:hypothetical protein
MWQIFPKYFLFQTFGDFFLRKGEIFLFKFWDQNFVKIHKDNISLKL